MNELNINVEDFINRNGLKLKSREEICVKVLEVERNSTFLDFRLEVLLPALGYDDVKRFLNAEAIKQHESGEDLWKPVLTSIEIVVEEFLSYMKFAWGKAQDMRGISANRSIDKLQMLLFLMGRDDLAEIINRRELYNPYGAPALIEVCDRLELPVPFSLREFAKEKVS